MKLRLPIITAIIAFASLNTFAQQVPNGDLEVWSPIIGSAASAEKPDGWDTPDVLGAVFGVSVAVDAKSTDAYSGEFSAELTTKDIDIPFVGTLAVPGTLALGSIVFETTPVVTAAIVGGYAMSEAPTSLSGYYKYSPAAGDSMNVAILAYKAGAQIGGGQMKDPTTITDWTMFDVPITYFTADIPDTIQVIITSSGGFTSATAGSVMKVDALAFTGIVAVENLQGSGIGANIYPNPTSDVININNPLNHNVTIEMYSMTGQKMDVMPMVEGLNSYSVSSYPAGIYMFRMVDNGNAVYSGKFKVIN